MDGRLLPGAKLPSTRNAKMLFGVSRNTAAEVYEKLQHSGYALARHGSGTFVADNLPISPSLTARSVSGPANERLNPFWLQPHVSGAINFWSEPRKPEPAASVCNVDFRPAMVQSRLFPYELLRRSVTKQMRQLETAPSSQKSPQGDQGNVQLREAIARHITLTRAVVCSPHDVVVTTGAQQAFDLIARTLVKPNKTVVAVEDPGYPPMRVPFIAAGARIVPVEVDAEGLIVEQLPPDAGIICVTPSHQFPLGVTMSRRRRTALVEFARSRNAVIVEDDYDGEFRFDDAPLEALRSANSTDVVFYVGTLSKCMLPSVRLGFVVAPDWALAALTVVKNSLDWQSSTLIQLSVADFIAEGHLARHIRKMRNNYKKRRHALLTGIKQELSEWLAPQASVYGIHVTALARPTINLDRVVTDLAQNGVSIHTLSRYFLGSQTKAGLIFGYATTDVPQIQRGLSVLRGALRRE